MKAVFLIFFLFFSSLQAHEKKGRCHFKNFERLCASPEIYVCQHFLSDKECNYLIELASSSLDRTTVADLMSSKNLIDDRRTSLGMFLPSHIENPIVHDIHRRISTVTNIPVENGESMQVLYYGVGAEYQPHHDYFDPSTPGGLVHFNRGGQRVATFMVYLNTPEAGGETVFPLAQIKITPEKGKAVLFFNVNSLGYPEKRSLHGGAPVVRGEKWLVTRWLRVKPFH